MESLKSRCNLSHKNSYPAVMDVDLAKVSIIRISPSADLIPFQISLKLLVFSPLCGTLHLFRYKKNESGHLQQLNIPLLESSSTVQWVAFISSLVKNFSSSLHQGYLSFRLLLEYHPKPITTDSAPSNCWSTRLQNSADISPLFWSNGLLEIWFIMYIASMAIHSHKEYLGKP